MPLIFRTGLGRKLTHAELDANFEFFRLFVHTRHIEVAANKPYTIDRKSMFVYDVEQIAIRCGAGTCTAAVQIDSVVITGMSAISVSTAEVTATSTGSKRMNLDQTLQVVITGNSAATDVAMTLKCLRVP